MKRCSLYLILSAKRKNNKDLLKIARESIRGGVDIIQLRWKDDTVNHALKLGKALRQLTNQSGILFIVNDRADLAKVLNADGVHVGQEDLPLGSVRSVIGRDKIVGVSAHNACQARKAEKEGADYISIGPVFPTPTKPGYKPVGLRAIKEISRRHLDMPFFAIGGIRQSNIQGVLEAGAKRVAVVRAIMNAKNVRRVARAIKEKLDS